VRLPCSIGSAWLVACGGELEFRVTVGIPSTTTAVTIDGVLVDPVWDGDKRLVSVDRTFASRPDADRSADISFEFHADAVLRGTGTAHSGACARSCTTDGCPSPDELSRESVTVSGPSFAALEYECLTCEGAGTQVTSCL
jgi:hypothetical protein